MTPICQANDLLIVLIELLGVGLAGLKQLLTVCTMIFMMPSAEQCLKMNLPLHLNSGVTTPSWIKSGPTGKIVALNTNLHIIGV